MPFKPTDALAKTKKAKSPKAQSQWAAIANSLLSSGAPEGSAIRQANGVIAKRASGNPGASAATPPAVKKRPPVPMKTYSSAKGY